MLKHADAAVVAAEQQQEYKCRICPYTSHGLRPAKIGKILLFQSLVGQDVPGDAYGDEDEESTEGPVFGDEDGAVEQCKP
jgi:hypothetical protein